MSDLQRARLLVLGAAVLWSTAGAAIKSTSLSAWQIAGGRALVAAIVLAVLLPEARRGLASPLTLLVALAYALTTVLFVLANTLTTAANAIFLQDVAPLWVLILAPLILGERPTRAELLSAPFYLGGAALFFFDKLDPAASRGNLIAIASGFAFAFLILGLRALRDGGRAEASVLLGNVLAVVISAPGAAQNWVAPAASDLAVLAFLGIFQLGFAYILFIRGLRGISAVEGSLLALVEPVLTPIWAFAIAGERPGPYALAGGGVILGATAFKHWRYR